MHLGELALFLKLGFSSVKWRVTPLLMGPPSLRCRQANFRVEFRNCGPLTSWMSPTSPCLLFFFFCIFDTAGPFCSSGTTWPITQGGPAGPGLPLLCARASPPRAKAASKGGCAGRAPEHRRLGGVKRGARRGLGHGRGSAFLKGGTFFFLKQSDLENGDFSWDEMS